jgi:hypothetical protein
MRINIPLGVTISSAIVWVFSLMTMALAASFNIKRRNYNSKFSTHGGHPFYIRYGTQSSP